MPYIVLPLHMIPVWIVAIVYITTAGYFIGYWNSGWDQMARPFFRANFFGGIFWAAYAWWLMAQTSEASKTEYRWYLASAIFGVIGVVESAMAVIHDRVPRWYRRVYYAGGLVAIVLVLGPTSLLVGRATFFDGHIALQPTLLLFALKWLIYGGGLLTFTAILAVAAWKRKTPRLIAFALAGLATLPFFIHDLFFKNFYSIFPVFPINWIPALIWAGVLWSEHRRHVVDTFQHITKDAVTDAYSRKFGERYLSQKLEDGPVAVVYADLDRFKQINDRYGHVLGDRVLQEFVRRVQTICHATDICIRLSGDEFLVVFPGVPEQQRDVLLGRLQHALNDPPFFVPGTNPPCPVGVSLGWAWAARDRSLVDLLGEADRRMYHVKQQHHAADTPVSHPDPVLDELRDAERPGAVAGDGQEIEGGEGDPAWAGETGGAV